MSLRDMSAMYFLQIAGLHPKSGRNKPSRSPAQISPNAPHFPGENGTSPARLRPPRCPPPGSGHGTRVTNQATPLLFCPPLPHVFRASSRAPWDAFHSTPAPNSGTWGIRRRGGALHSPCSGKGDDRYPQHSHPVRREHLRRVRRPPTPVRRRQVVVHRPGCA